MSRVMTSSYVVSHADVLYVGQQINSDLIELARAYSDIFSFEEALGLFNSYTTFLANSAVSNLGFTIYDPSSSNLVYHESQYEVVYGEEVYVLNPSGHSQGVGGRSVTRIWVPNTVRFKPWVVWSSTMLALTEAEQESIVSGTNWDIPSRNTTFQRRYVGGNWEKTGIYARGNVAVQGSTYGK